jgi:Ser/Thr protein kinase RdoA (MazF antagonist)
MMTPAQAAERWGRPDAVRVCPDAGLINRTYLVGDPPWGVLQWVNPIFAPQVNMTIALVTERLSAHGLTTPLIEPTLDGDLWVTDTEGCWRMLRFIPGRTVHTFSSTDQAASAAALVGRFHTALVDLHHDFPGQRRHAHDTNAHMRTLVDALESADAHPLAVPARQLGGQILDAWNEWDGDLDLIERPCHGDLKVSNIRMDNEGRFARCLIDLDTLGTVPYAVEMGDAWRSWCNPATEDDWRSTRFDIPTFEATAHAWLQHAPAIEDEERESLAPGIERICLELSARFCADAIRNNYFREDLGRFPDPGEHNILRARSQFTLAQSVLAQRTACEQVIRDAANSAAEVR